MNTRTLALVGVVGLGASACVADGSDAGMRIIGNVAPGEGCSVDSTSTTFRDDGVIEVDSSFGYLFTPSVINDLVVVGDEPLGPKTIYITHAEVDIEFYDPDFANLAVDPGLVEFQVPTSGPIDPGGGTSAFSFEIVPAELIHAIGDQLGTPTTENPVLRTTLDVRIRMVGTRGGGEEKSNIFRYPVEVCAGCTFQIVGDCAGLPAGYMGSPGGACNVLQDGLLQCCTTTTGLTCPAAPLM